MSANPGFDNVDTVSLNPATLAATLREEALPYVDDFLQSEDGDRIAPEESKEEARALWIGEAVRQALLDDRIHEEIEPSSSRHDRLEGELVAGDVRRAASEELFASAAQELLYAEAMGGNALSKRRKAMALGAKAVFLIGDTAVLAGVFYRAGLDMPLAIASGISMAATVVGCGTHFGRELAMQEQRRQRGAPPEHCPPGLVDLFEADGDATSRPWTGVAGGVVGGLLLAMTLLGLGLGDPWLVAIAYGIFAALTFAGSASTEAYATNAAAERVEECTARMSRHAAELERFEQMEGQAAEAGRKAAMLATAAQFGAGSAAITGTVTADRRPDTPAIFGYEPSRSSRQAPLLQPPPGFDSHVDPSPMPARPRVREVRRLRMAFAAQAQGHGTEHTQNGNGAAS